jgi:hypothetical protein
LACIGILSKHSYGSRKRIRSFTMVNRLPHRRRQPMQRLLDDTLIISRNRRVIFLAYPVLHSLTSLFLVLWWWISSVSSTTPWSRPQSRPWRTFVLLHWDRSVGGFVCAKRQNNHRPQNDLESTSLWAACYRNACATVVEATSYTFKRRATCCCELRELACAEPAERMLPYATSTIARWEFMLSSHLTLLNG